MNSQVVQHVSHVAAVIEGVSVRLLSLVHLSLALEDISQVTPCCAVKEHNTILRTKTCIQHGFCVFRTSGENYCCWYNETLCKSI